MTCTVEGEAKRCEGEQAICDKEDRTAAVGVCIRGKQRRRYRLEYYVDSGTEVYGF